MSNEAIIDDSHTLAAEIGKLLAGKPSVIVTIALADCLARCFATHVVIGDPAATTHLREKIIERNFLLVRQFVDMYARERAGEIDVPEESPK